MTPTMQLVELRLGGDLAGYLDRARDKGLSWRLIASDVQERTGLSVSHEAVRRWHGEAERKTGAVA